MQVNEDQGVPPTPAVSVVAAVGPVHGLLDETVAAEAAQREQPPSLVGKGSAEVPAVGGPGPLERYIGALSIGQPYPLWAAYCFPGPSPNVWSSGSWRGTVTRMDDAQGRGRSNRQTRKTQNQWSAGFGAGKAPRAVRKRDGALAPLS